MLPLKSLHTPSAAYAPVPAHLSPSPPPPRWNTSEFYVYYAFFLVCVPYMFKVGFDVSRKDDPHYQQYQGYLSEGWMFGRTIDNSDSQYRTVRSNLPTLIFLMIFYLILSHTFRYVFARRTPLKLSTDTLYRAYFFLGASLVYISVTNGFSLLIILTICTINYAIGKIACGSRWNPVLTWIFNIGLLFVNARYEGYKFGVLDPTLAWMDDYRGLNPRWHILFNFTMLRLVSFNMDYYWQCRSPRSVSADVSPQSLLPFSSADKGDRDGTPATDKDRIVTPCFETDYRYTHYLAYVLYTPLYMCGPIITFNNFISQLRYPHDKITWRTTAVYAIRLAYVILLMEFLLHTMYVVAISKAKAWGGDTPLQISMIGYWNLKIIWLKLLIPWRFFRLWAMADGIQTEENMGRCMSNNYSAQKFWQQWHRSYNRWNIRYIYIPLGGAKYFAYNTWIIFTFVALWHDIQLRLLAWGWLICLFLLPEIIGTRLFSQKQWGSWPYYRHVCAVGAVLNMMMMMVANLVGFCVGLDGMAEMLQQFRTLNGISFLITASICMFVGVQVMFEYEEMENRKRWREKEAERRG